MFDISKALLLALSISLTVFFAACAHAVTLSWDPSADWGALPDAHNAAQRNPNGDWSYGESAGIGGALARMMGDRKSVV